MNAPVTVIHAVRSARMQIVMAIAAIRGFSAGLSQIQIEALSKFARDRFIVDGVSAARAISDAGKRAKEVAKGIIL